MWWIIGIILFIAIIAWGLFGNHNLWGDKVYEKGNYMYKKHKDTQGGDK